MESGGRRSGDPERKPRPTCPSWLAARRREPETRIWPQWAQRRRNPQREETYCPYAAQRIGDRESPDEWSAPTTSTWSLLRITSAHPPNRFRFLFCSARTARFLAGGNGANGGSPETGNPRPEERLPRFGGHTTTRDGQLFGRFRGQELQACRRKRPNSAGGAVAGSGEPKDPMKKTNQDGSRGYAPA